MELEKLLDGLHALDDQITALRAEKKKLAKQIDEKITIADLKKKLGTLNDPQKQLLLQVIKAEGIESLENVPKVGAVSG